MMRIFLKDEDKKKALLKNGLYLDQMRFKCVPAKEDQNKKLVFQCFNCQQWNSHKTWECENVTKCVICSGPHKKTDCTKKKEEALCSNCGLGHAAWSPECTVYKNEIEKKKKSFATVTSEAVITPSLLEEILGQIRTQIAIIVAEVVSKALLEHIYYEAEYKKSGGTKYLGAAARVASIAKMATVSVNKSPFSKNDKSVVTDQSVHTEVMERLKASFSVNANGNKPSTASQPR
jgi:hypothetical protein